MVSLKVLWGCLGFVGGADAVVAEQLIPPTVNIFGEAGLIEMPTADSAPDAQFSQSVGTFNGEARVTLSFQISPRLSGSFRYATIDEYTGPGTGRTWDRSFDLRYRLIEEGAYRPAVAVGLRDFIGTGLYTGEYVVATKGIGDNVRATVGLGWGRLGSHNGFANPLGALSDGLKTRVARDVGKGGTFDPEQWFSGDAAAFGGIEYFHTADLSFKAEYSSDAYTRRTALGTIDRKSSMNFGVTYRGWTGVELAGYYLYGSEIGASVAFVLNPRERREVTGREPAPVPVKVRAQGAAAVQSWAQSPQTSSALQSGLARVLAADGLTLEAMDLSATRVRIRVRNETYGAAPQMIGRVARILTQAMPASVETFVIEPVSLGVPTAAVTLRRSDLEAYENAPNGAWEMFTRTGIAETGAAQGFSVTDGLYPKFNWSIGPYGELALFDPDSPARYDIGAEARASYEIVPGLVLAGSVRQRAIGTLDQSQRVSNSVLPRVRSDAYLYAKNDRPTLERLTLGYTFRPAPTLYGRVSVGYLERMFGGLSAEVLWKPVDSRLAFGADINYVRQRDFDLGLGFQGYEVLTGHGSAYYDFGNGYHAQVDLGRYLAGDYGGTLTLSREFANGWKLGAFATITDVPFAEFGEGSFDKGITFTIPVDWALGKPSTKSFETVIRPILRDGGARLGLQDRLYSAVRTTHRPDLEKRWGRFWR